MQRREPKVGACFKLLGMEQRSVWLGEVGKSTSLRVQVVFDGPRLGERAREVDVDGEARTGAPQCKRLGRNWERVACVVIGESTHSEVLKRIGNGSRRKRSFSKINCYWPVR